MRKKLSLKRIILILLVCSGLIGILTVSYAFFTTSVSSKEYVIYTGNLKVDYEKSTDVLNLQNIYPMEDKDGLNQKDVHEFTVTNHGNVSARYQIRLEIDDTIKNMIPIKYIKVSYKKDSDDYSNPVLLSDLNSSLVFLRNMTMEPKEVHHYGIKLWIDISAPNEIQGKEFKAKIVVDSIQNVEDGYVVDTAPIITLKKDANGNQDVHLKVGDTYQELGVEKVEDDQEIFTPSDVKKTIEYYNGTGEEVTIVENVNTNQTGIYYINYQVTDKSNNVGQATRVVVVNNTDVKPTIELKENSTLTLGKGDYYKEKGVEVEDENQVVTIGEVKTSVIGNYTVRYIVIDKAGNLNSVVRTVEVSKPYHEDILNGTDPVLASNLIPVTIEENGGVKRASTLSEWYDYETKKWANVVILKDESENYENDEIIPEDKIESYFVWIPKYKYQLFNLEEYNGVTQIENKNQEIKIQFGLDDTSDKEGECTTPKVAGAIGSCKKGDYMTHPAFLAFGGKGFWVGKFETGYDGATQTSDAEINEPKSDKIIIKPNVYSWRNINVGNALKASYDYQRNLDSHMMKNTEWGAVAYLQHSIYGSEESVRINNNSNYITGYAATEEPEKGYNAGTDISGNHVSGTELNQDGDYTKRYNSETGYKASTTGNISGIYDMSGGAWEYVMGYTTQVAKSEEDSGIITNFLDFFSNEEWEKYYDSYTSTINTSYSNRILGDATGEMGPFGKELDPDANYHNKSSWYKDYADFVNSSHPWFARGGYWNYGSAAGVFAFTRGTGGAHLNTSFRIVLAPNN